MSLLLRNPARVARASSVAGAAGVRRQVATSATERQDPAPPRGSADRAFSVAQSPQAGRREFIGYGINAIIAGGLAGAIIREAWRTNGRHFEPYSGKLIAEDVEITFVASHPDNHEPRAFTGKRWRRVWKTPEGEIRKIEDF